MRNLILFLILSGFAAPSALARECIEKAMNVNGIKFHQQPTRFNSCIIDVVPEEPTGGIKRGYTFAPSGAFQISAYLDKGGPVWTKAFFFFPRSRLSVAPNFAGQANQTISVRDGLGSKFSFSAKSGALLSSNVAKFDIKPVDSRSYVRLKGGVDVIDATGIVMETPWTTGSPLASKAVRIRKEGEKDRWVPLYVTIRSYTSGKMESCSVAAEKIFDYSDTLTLKRPVKLSDEQLTELLQADCPKLDLSGMNQPIKYESDAEERTPEQVEPAQRPDPGPPPPAPAPEPKRDPGPPPPVPAPEPKNDPGPPPPVPAPADSTTTPADDGDESAARTVSKTRRPATKKSK